MELNVDYGNVQFKSDKQLTIADVARLAEAAQIAGIPPNAQITSMNFSWYQRYPEPEVTLNISWRMPSE